MERLLLTTSGIQDITSDQDYKLDRSVFESIRMLTTTSQTLNMNLNFFSVKCQFTFGASSNTLAANTKLLARENAEVIGAR